MINSQFGLIAGVKSVVPNLHEGNAEGFCTRTAELYFELSALMSTIDNLFR
jgi:hypothetical protein